jgi:hypothetical protein
MSPPGKRPPPSLSRPPRRVARKAPAMASSAQSSPVRRRTRGVRRYGPGGSGSKAQRALQVWLRRGIALVIVSTAVFAGWTTFQAIKSRTPPSADVTVASAYTLDEQARLSYAYDAVIELEKQQAYGELYDTWASPAFQANVDRGTFMSLAQCADGHLGPLEGYQRPSLRLQRRQAPHPDASAPTLDELSAKVGRRIDRVWEMAVFKQNGLSYQLQGFYWSAPYPPFQQCMRTALAQQAINRQTAEQQVLHPNATQEPPATQGSTAQAPTSDH